MNPPRKNLRSHLIGNPFRAGCTFVALGALGCTGMVESPSEGPEPGVLPAARATLAAGGSASAPGSVGGSASAPGSVGGSAGAPGSVGGSAGASVPSGIEPSAPTVELPSDYRTWPVFLANVQRADNGQVRDVYVNPIGATVQQGQPFPMGTVLVMDLFAAQKDDTGAPVLDGNGHLIKAALLKTFVMGKDTGWGNYVSSDLRNGDWLYAAYATDGKTPTADPLPPCFSCHLPLGASQDWVQRYADYFQQRATSQ